MVKKVGKYELGKTLGEGTFGKVQYGLNSETSESVAIKVLDKERIQSQNMGNQIKREINIMKMVKHKYVVEMVEVLASKTKIFIVLELVTGGELFDKIVAAGKLNEEQARFYFKQLVEGVEYCHKLGICHRDLKPENLLLDSHGNLKISDFGLSSLYVGDADDGAGRTELLHTTCGTPNYVAPEVLADKGYDGKKADVWSCGVILYVLLAGFLPFDETTIAQLFVKIQAADFSYPSWFTPQVRSLLDIMLVADPKVRVTLGEIQHHPWYLVGGPLAASAGETAATASASHHSAKAPTEAQIDAAAHQHDSIGQDVDDSHADHPAGEQLEPVRLNAFDLVAQCGGFMVDKLFVPELFYTLTGGSDEASAASAAATAGGYVKNRCFHFTASNISAEEMTTTTFDQLLALGFTSRGSKDDAARSGIIDATLMTGKGMVGMSVQVFYLTPALVLIEIKKGKGDLLEWNNAYSELVNKRLAHLINKLK